MELLIQGSKNGYFVHSSSNFPKNFAEDSRIEDVENNRKTVGNSMYSIAISTNGVIFSKSIGIWDVQRKSVGTLSFSVFLSKYHKLRGDNVKQVLDNLTNTYWRNYISDEGDLNSNIHEDWPLFDSISSECDNNIIELKESFLSDYNQGFRDSAFIYYSGIDELKKYLDAPYQEEYFDFKQVYFVEKSFEGKPECPLNTVKHDSNSNLTGVIELDNPKYKLIFQTQSNNGIDIDIKLNDTLVSNGVILKRNDVLDITWSKKFREPYTIKGTCLEISEFVIINEDDRIIKLNKFPKLDPITYNFDFKILDHSSDLVYDAAIYIKIGDKNIINVSGNKISLSAEDLQNKCVVYARKGQQYSLKKEISVENLHNVISLKLFKERNIQLIVKGENDELLTNFYFNNYNFNKNPKDGVISLLENDIIKGHDFIVKHKDYEPYTFNNYEFGENDFLSISLVKNQSYSDSNLNRKKIKFLIDTSKGNDYLKYNNKEFDYIPTVDYKVEGKYGYKFVKWDIRIHSTNKNQEIHEAIFKESWYGPIPQFIWALLIIIIIGGIFSVVYILEKPSTATKPYEIDEIVSSYVEGGELNLDTLENYKKMYCIDQGILSDYSCSNLESAIALRKAINQGDLEKIKEFKFSNQQNSFEKTIDSISMLSSTKKAKIVDLLKSKSNGSLTLSQLLDIINRKSDSNNPKVDTNHDLTESDGQINKTSVKKEKFNSNNSEKIPSNDGVKDEKSDTHLNNTASENVVNPDMIVKFKNELKQLIRDENSTIQDYKSLKNKYINVVGPNLDLLKSICRYSKKEFVEYKKRNVIDVLKSVK
jgi:hypothetical protein